MKLISALLFVLILGFNASAQDTIYANISIAQAKDTIASHENDPWFVILDVRRPDEYSVKHLEEGVMLNYSSPDFATQLATLNRSKTYLIHCAGGSRSAQVYTQMQNLHFKRVYNMLGGINSWYSASYPTTTSVASDISALCNTNILFNNTLVSEKDSILATITNSANDTLRISNISDLTGTEFSTNLNTDTKIIGARDYSFYVYYSPIDELADSIVFSVQTNGGNIEFLLHGKTTTTTIIKTENLFSKSIINDVANHKIIFSSELNPSRVSYSLYDMIGKQVLNSDLSNNNQIDYSSFTKGIYILKLNIDGNFQTYKLLLP